MAEKKNFSAQPVVASKNTVPGEAAGNEVLQTSNFLPGYFRTDTNVKFLSTTLDKLVSKGTPEDINLYVGKKSGTVYRPTKDFYLEEPRSIRADYQLEPGVVFNDIDGNVTDALAYDDFIEQLKLNWNKTKPDCLDSEYYIWNPPIDTDMFTNFTSYYWLKFDPLPIQLEGTINVTEDIIGKLQYTTPVQPNGKQLTFHNGMKVYFINKNSITSFSGQNPGAGYTNGYYQGVTLVGLTEDVVGAGVKVNLTVDGGFVSQVELVEGGQGYKVGDILRCGPNIIGPGTNFSVTVTAITAPTVTPAEYVSSPDPLVDPTYFIVSGVGDSIKLIPSAQLDPRTPYTMLAYVPWDGVNWDRKKWDTSEPAPIQKEYIVMDRGARDQNPWSRTNKWYHVDAVKAVCEFLDVNSADYLKLEQRAARPIVQFTRDIELFNYGKNPKTPVDLVIDGIAPSTITAESAYIIDGITLKNDYRVVFINGNHTYNNKIYRVTGVGSGISFVAESDNVPVVDDKLFVLRGSTYIYKELWFDGSAWLLGQNKTKRNQFPLFTLYDKNAVGIGNTAEYPDSDFAGNTLFQYQVGTVYDDELGFNIAYESTNFDIIDNASPFAKTFTNIVFDVTQHYPIYYRDTLGLRSQIAGNYYYQYWDEKLERYNQSNGWVKNSEPPKTYQRISKTVNNKYNDNVVTIPLDSTPSYRYMLTQEYGQPVFWCLSKNGEWERFDPVTNTLVVPNLGVASILNMSGLPLTFVDDNDDPDLIFVVNNGADSGLIEIGCLEAVNFRYVFNGQKGLVIVTDMYNDPRSFLVRINGYDKTVGFTYEENNGAIDVTVDSSVLNNGDIIEVLFESSVEWGVYAVHNTVEANANNETFLSVGYNQVFNHFKSKLLSTYGLVGEGYGKNNYYNIHKNAGAGWVIQQQENSSLKMAALLRLNETNPVNVLRFGAEQVKIFRQKFLQKISVLVSEIDVAELTAAEMLDKALTDINVGKSHDFTHAYSDMLYYGPVKSTVTYTIDELAPTTVTYALPIAVDTTDPYRNHVYVYIDNVIKTQDSDYTLNNTTVDFNQLTGPCTIKIVVYETKDNCFVPSSLSKLGMAPVYRPQFVWDDTYPTTTKFIQCHDGSMIVAYDDYRDDIIYEYETRVYNNICDKFKQKRFQWANAEPGVFRATRVSREDKASYIGDLFRLWKTSNGVNELDNSQFYQQPNKFTWNYTTVSSGLGGSWRSIYKALYDTDRPHSHPWEMLGYSIKPTWWDTHYSWSDPYKRGPLIDALQAGNVACPPSVVIDHRFARPGMSFPVTQSAELQDPVTAGLLSAPSQENAQLNWVAGDLGNQELAWVRSEEYPWALAQWYYTVAPNKYVEKSWQPEYEGTDFYNTQYSVSQLLNARPMAGDYLFHRELFDGNVTVRYGLENIIAESLVSDSKTLSDYFYNQIRYATVQNIFKVGGFADKRNLAFLADSLKTQSGGNFIPEENYNLTFYKGTPYKEFFYSGVKVVFNGTGYEVQGYDFVNPYFTVYKPKNSTRVTEFTYGNITVKEALDWETTPSQVDYGTTFNSREGVVNFLLGLQRWIVEQGVVFTDFDNNMNGIKDFRQSAQQFLFWSETKWTEGYYIALSPCANKLVIQNAQGFVEDFNQLSRGFAPLIDKDKVPLDVSLVRVTRADDGVTTVTTKNDQTGLFGIRIRIIDIEHAVIFDNITAFNDIVYDPILRLKQYRLKFIGQRTADWMGRPSAPGYLINGSTVIANYDRTISDMETRYFNVEGSTLNTRLVETARHNLGINTTSYLDNLLLNPTVAFEFQRGMIRQQGTPAVYSKLLRNTNVEGEISTLQELQVDEEWMFKLGEFGANETQAAWELQLKQREFKDNKQLFRFLPDYDPTTERSNIDRSTDRIIDVMSSDNRWIDRPGTGNLSFPVRKKTEMTDDQNEIVFDTDLPNAGFVSFDDVDFVTSDTTTVVDLYDSIDISTKQTIWIGNYKEGNWSVLAKQKSYTVVEIVKADDSPTGPTNVVFDVAHNFVAGDVLYITGSDSNATIDGMVTVAKVVDTLTVQIPTIVTDAGTTGTVYLYAPVVFETTAQLEASKTSPRYDWVDNELAYVKEDSGYTVYQWQSEYRVGNDITMIPVLYQAFDQYSKETPLVDTYKIHEANIYDHKLDRILIDLELFDPYKGIIPSVADIEIDHKGNVDPAQYEFSTDDNVSVNSDSYWGERQVGTVWWDTSNVKYVEYEQGTLDYRSKNWGKLFTGSTIDIYEWIETSVDPIAYTKAVENGTPVDGQVPSGTAKVTPKGDINNTSYSTKVYTTETGAQATKYYFWVKNKTTLPNNRKERRIPVASLASIITDPTNSGISWFAPISQDSFIIANVSQFLNDTTTSLQIKFKTDDTNVHSQWMILRENDGNVGIPEWLHIRLRDSLVGYDSTTYISKYTTYQANTAYAFGSIVKQNNNYYRAYRTFTAEDTTRAFGQQPFYKLYEYTLLANNRIRMPLPNDVPDPRLNQFSRYGNRIRPTQQSWIKNRSEARRNFVEVANQLLASIDLVNTVNNWNKHLQDFTKGEYNYELTKFWEYIDYVDPAYDDTIPYSYEVESEQQIFQLTATLNNGDYVLVKNDAIGKFAVYEYIDEQQVLRYRKNGTIAFKEILFNSQKQQDTWDAGPWDFKQWDPEPSQEFYEILTALREDIFINQYATYYNKLFFAMVRYVYSEHNRVDWIAKSTYLHVDNLAVKGLTQKPFYEKDTVEQFIDYIDQTKPYRSKLREVLDTRNVDDSGDITAEDYVYPQVTLRFNRTGQGPSLVNSINANVDVANGILTTMDFNTYEPGQNRRPWDFPGVGIDPTREQLEALLDAVYNGGDFGILPEQLQIAIDGAPFNIQRLEQNPDEELAILRAGDALEILVETRYLKDTPPAPGESPYEKYSFRMLKALNNEWSYSRISNDAKTVLVSDITPESEYIVVEDATKLSGVDITFRRPGIIFIGGERIEYYEANGNVLGKLVRGTLGTGAGSYTAGTIVMDADPVQTIPVERERTGAIIFNKPTVIFNELGKTMKESRTLATIFITEKQGDLNR